MSTSGGASLAIKRAFDVTSCLVIGAVAAPLFPVLAVLVKWGSPGPLFFTQDRAGRDARPFKMLKLRTMHVAPPGHDASKWTTAEQARITRAGKLLRDYGLDELPQLWNILRGDMSVIGPRPPLPVQAAQFTPEQRRMFDMRPGVLSLAATRGRRSITAEDRIRYHVWYVDNWSLWLDLTILYKCVFVVLGRQDVDERLSNASVVTGV